MPPPTRPRRPAELVLVGLQEHAGRGPETGRHQHHEEGDGEDDPRVVETRPRERPDHPGIVPVMGRRSVLVVLAVLAVAVPASYAIAGGSSYSPHQHRRPVPDDSRLRHPNDAEALQSVVLDGAARAACKLGISREALMLALGDPRTRAALGPEAPAALADGLRGALARRRARPRRRQPGGRPARRRVGARDRRRGARDEAALPASSRSPKTDATSAVVARLLVDAARRAACARNESLATLPGGARARRDARSGRRRVAARRHPQEPRRGPGRRGARARARRRAGRGRPRARSRQARDAAARRRRCLPAADVAASPPAPMRSPRSSRCARSSRRRAS